MVADQQGAFSSRAAFRRALGAAQRDATESLQPDRTRLRMLEKV